MIVVADSGPLHYLILLGHVDLLRRFYGEVLVPEAVARELSVGSTPDVVRDWIAAAPSWVDVRPLAGLVLTTCHWAQFRAQSDAPARVWQVSSH
ncbi:MAG: hypothetical protein FJW27_06010 [Acidimicrobiia bacterium]|nr:hypothetical protein [Acidimicrobiia bacterium]